MGLANVLQGRRCQEWMREFVERLVKKGILTEGAEKVLDEAKSLEGSTPNH